MDILMMGLIVSVMGTMIGGGWFLLHQISSQFHALRHELENKIEATENRSNDRMQKLEDRMESRMQQLENRVESRMQKLEDGQIDLGRQIARLEGMLSSRQQPSGVPQAA